MKRKFIFTIFLIILISKITFSQTSFEDIKSKWKQKQYAEVKKSGIELRNTLKGRGIPALDYMILSSICMTTDKKAEVCSKIPGVIKDYYIGLPDNYFKLMQRGFSNICESNNEPDFQIADNLPPRLYAHSQRNAGMSGRFKSYMMISTGLNKNGVFQKINYREVMDIVEAKKLDKDSLKRLSADLIETYTKNRVHKNDTVGVKRAVKRYGPNTNYYTSENFLVISAKVNKIKVKDVAANMEKALGFFKKEYAFSLPDDYIVIYLAPDYKSVKPYIEKLYLTKLSFTPLGFSNFYDNSMLGWIYDGSAVGTLKHELVHLLISSKVNFIPEWFEEGLASLYEESKFDSSFYLQAKDNWRGIILKETHLNYSLNDLFANREIDFNGKELDSLKTAYKEGIKEACIKEPGMMDYFNHNEHELEDVLNVFLSNKINLYKDALSRYFLLYLQDNRKLNDLYQALVQRDSSVMDVENYQPLESVITTVCEKGSVDELQKDFSKWLDNKYAAMPVQKY